MFFSTSRINISGNQMLKNFVFPVLMLVLLSLEGCAYSAYGVYDDQRLLDTISDDKAMATSIKTALLNEHFLGGMAISVYCFYGIPDHVNKWVSDSCAFSWTRFLLLICVTQL